jgi:hypothetical protein
VKAAETGYVLLLGDEYKAAKAEAAKKQRAA